MFDYAHLLALTVVLRKGSFDTAAAELGITPSAVSQRIKALEERLGTVLVIRGQPCRPTDAGARLTRHTEEVQLLEHMLADDLGGGARRDGFATLRIAVNADSLATWIIPALATAEGFLFDVVVDDQDHSADWLRRGEVAAAVTARADPVQGCDTVALGALRYLATASPAYVARWFEDGVTAQSLARAPALTFDIKDRLQIEWIRQVAGRRVGHPSHMVPSSQGFVEAALAGLGWGMNPEPLIAAHLASGRLVPLIADRPLDVALYWQTSRMTARALQPLTRAVRAAAARVMASG